MAFENIFKHSTYCDPQFSLPTPIIIKLKEAGCAICARTLHHCDVTAPLANSIRLSHPARMGLIDQWKLLLPY